MRQKKGKKKMLFIIIGSVVLLAVLVIGGLSIYSSAQMKKIPGMTYEDCLQYTLAGNKDAVITVGVWKDGQASYRVYGEDAKELPHALHTYEIGSLTKTFTAALIAQAAEEGRLTITDTLDRYLPLPAGTYPTIKQVLTHTSGMKNYYTTWSLIINSMKGKNSFYQIPGETIIEQLSAQNGKLHESPFLYSNFGYAVLGSVLEAVYGEPYQTLLNRYATDTLGLSDTKISDQAGDLGKYWDWQSTDAYLSAGAITSNIEDMLQYAKLQLEEAGSLKRCHTRLSAIQMSDPSYPAMGICMDSIAMAWIIDEKNGILWHNGGTSNYNSYLGFCPQTNTAVVVLSNLSPNSRIPATVLGAKLLQELK